MLDKGTRVWIPHSSKVWSSGVVLRSEDGTHRLIVLCDGEESYLSRENPPFLCNPEILLGANDLTTLSYLHEPAVLHSLQLRYEQSAMIYTYCGIVLVAINPYQSLPIYGDWITAAYSSRDPRDMDPHVFAVAQEAHQQLKQGHGNQSIIVSGESGAGKTVNAKYIFQYFASVSGESTEVNIESKVLASNNIVEAVGNAKTTRNDNSSRFGKYIEICFDGQFDIRRAQLRTYLLEKTRVVTQSNGERNYHIFYQLLANRDNPKFQHLNLGAPHQYYYTNQGDSSSIDGVDDKKMFGVFINGLDQLGFVEQQKRQLFNLLSSILHLGNVQVKEATNNDSSCVPEDQESLKQSSLLLGISSSSLSRWLCNRQIITTREVLTKPLTVSQAISSRDSLSSHLYDQLFKWIVDRINQCLSGSHSHSESFIGVLDIYGFEVFKHNSFEQFCINYANEKLQQQFNMHVFKLEQQEYMSEGITWSFIDYYDNQPCIDLIEGRMGILDLLNETCKMPGSSDAMFTDKLYGQILKTGHSHFSKPRTSRTSFCVRHYASVVVYETEGFMAKNTDLLSREHLKLLQSSQNSFISSLFPHVAKEGRKINVGSMFKDSLKALMDTLNMTTPHYIRCIKPNDTKTPFNFNRVRVVEQLRACGIIETIRISAAGFPSRYLYKEFIDRYWILLPRVQLQTLRREELERDQIKLCQVILKAHINDTDKYRIGKNKVFFRAGQVAYLETLRSDVLHHSCIIIQRNLRMWRERKRYRKVCIMVRGLQCHIRGLIARRKAQWMREDRAATKIQSQFRMYRYRKLYLSLREACLHIQSYYRGMKARYVALAIKESKAAVVIQSCWRGWVGRKHCVWRKRSIIRVQCRVRQWIAIRRLKELKAEARSVSHLQNLNKGLELKIIELQRKLTQEEAKNSHLLATNKNLEQRCEELEQLATYKTHWETLNNKMEGVTEELKNERIQREALENDLIRIKAEHLEIEELRQLETALFNEQLEQLNAKLKEIEDHDEPTQKTPARSLSVQEKLTVQESLTESIRRVKTMASSRLQEGSNAELNESIITCTSLMDDASMYYSLPSEMREWNESSVNRNQSFFSQQSTSSNNAIIKFLQEEVNRLTEENCKLKDDIGMRYLTEDVALVALSPYNKRKGGGGGFKTVQRFCRPKPVLGMLSWKQSDLSRIMKTLITEPDPSLGEDSSVSCIEAHLLFMCLRYADHCSSELMTTQLIENTVTSIQYITKYYKDNLKLLCHWLGNITCLLQCMRQYSGDPVYYNPCKDVSGLTSFELTDYHDFVTAEASSIYYMIIIHMEKTLEPLIVPGLLEHQSIPGLTNTRPIGWGRTLLGMVKTLTVSVNDIEQLLNDLFTLLEYCLVDPDVIEQMFKQIFYFINGIMLNYLLFRKDLCHWTSGMQIRYNLNILEEWLRSHKLIQVLEMLQPIIQATKLLQMRKETENDAKAICELCEHLNIQQIQKLLRMYTPSVEFERRVPSSVIQFVGQYHRRSGSETESLTIDARYQFPVTIPYSPMLALPTKSRFDELRMLSSESAVPPTRSRCSVSSRSVKKKKSRATAGHQ